MRCYVDHPSRDEFKRAFKSVGDLMFVKSRESLSEPDITLGAAAEDHRDLLLVGPDRIWFARVERDAGGALKIFDGKKSIARKRKVARRRRRN